MRHAIYPPPPQIANLVRYFWILESTPFSYTPPRYLALADSSPELIFQYNLGFKEFTGTAHFVAQRSISKWRHLHDQVGMFGVRFYPYALRQIIGITSDELNDTASRLDELLGPRGASLTEQVTNAESISERITMVTSFLKDTIVNREPTIEFIVKIMMYHNGNIDLDLVQTLIGLSERQFQRKFKEYVGYPPKYFMRMLRFQSARRWYIAGSFETLTNLSFVCGYADQSHFCREFKEFSGIPALKYFDLINQTETESKITRELIVAKDVPPDIH